MITYIILAITVFTSITAMDNHTLKNKLMFNAYMIKERKEWYRFFSHGIIHADWMHLGFNMLSLYMFGKAVEDAYAAIFDGKGMLFFIILYVGGLVMSSLYSYERNKTNIYYNSLGASGAVSAVIYAYIMLAPTAQLGIMFIPVPIPAYIFGFIYLGIEYYLSKRGNTGIAHDAHFWGAIYGIVLTIILRPHAVSIFLDQILGR
ncbi:MAG: rhomboid family intramembrane serine protease [Bacteroidetes bacterium]|nr:rhomboid family intramembrane serine protease [Bacteroidota bacterium]